MYFFYTPARKNEHVYIHARMLEHFEHFEIIEKNESFSKKIIEGKIFAKNYGMVIEKNQKYLKLLKKIKSI